MIEHSPALVAVSAMVSRLIVAVFSFFIPDNFIGNKESMPQECFWGQW
jgi:hypothetical protein